MTDSEPPEELTASASELPWPDPSRPVVNNIYGNVTGEVVQAGDIHGGLVIEPAVPQSQRRWPMILTILVLLVLALVTVWLLWWR